MKILHVSCSPRGHASESHRLARKIVGYLLEGDPNAEVMDRVVAGGGIPPVDEDYAISQQAVEDVELPAERACGAVHCPRLCRDPPCLDAEEFGCAHGPNRAPGAWTGS